MTHTYAALEVSRQAYDEIAGKLREAGYDHAFDKDTGAIDMHDIGLVLAPKPSVSAVDIRRLRELTGNGLRECRMALLDANGNMERAARSLHPCGMLPPNWPWPQPDPAPQPPAPDTNDVMANCEWTADTPDACPYCSGVSCALCGPMPNPPCTCDSYDRHIIRKAS